MSDIELKNITKKFGKVIAVKDFNLAIKDKEFVTLVGPSGCGKTTSLNILAGLLDPDEGDVYIGGKHSNNLPPGKRDIAMVFQSYALYPHMNVRENIGFCLRIKKVPKKERDEKVLEVAKFLGIEELLDRKPKEISGGQRQRVALGRAIIRRPKAFLLDEPLSNLDAKLRVQMRADLKILFNQLGGTVLYVTHDQLEAMTLSDRVVVMKDGFIQQCDSPKNVYNNPVNMFVAGFIGSPSMNFIICEYNDGYLFSEDIKLKLNEKILKKIGTSGFKKNYILGIRPENILIAKESSIKFTVEIFEDIGSSLIIYLKNGKNRIDMITSDDFGVKNGENIYLDFPLEKIHIFDIDSKESILLKE